ncbi:MAG: hypothetical protein Q7S95_02110 [bacterium]|nr:hypothetical protein [bacterium]
MDRLPFGFSNASGWPKNPKGVAKLAAVSVTTRILAGAFTVEAREERGGGTDFAVLDDGTASNNRRLPNGGIPYLRAHGREMVQIAHDAGKELIMSGAPFSPEEDGILAEWAFMIGADGYESDRSCGNAGDIIAGNHELMEACDEAVAKAIGDRPWWRKLPPYFNPKDREIEADLTRRSTARGVVACNAFPGVRLRRDGKPIITATGTNGLGAMSGTGLKLIAHANAEHFCELLNPFGLEVIGVGGIRTIDDMQDYLLVGCIGVQVGAALFKSEDPRVLQHLGEDWMLMYAP